MTNATDDLSLRKMTCADLPEVLQIEAASYEFPWSKGVFGDCIKAGYHCQVAVSLDTGTLMGYSIMMLAADEGQILNLCVAPKLRRQGVAGRLLSRQLEIARSGQASKIFLEVRPSNSIAVELYESLGFSRLAVRPEYYRAAGGREDALVLVLALSTEPAESR